jgi:hypothetical protein
MKKYALPLIFGLIIILSYNSFSQGIYNNPDSLIHVGDFSNAKIALIKIIFETKPHNAASTLWLEKNYLTLSEISFKQKKYSESYDYVKQITNDSLIENNDITYKKSFYSYLAADFATCEYEIKLERLKKKDTIDHRLYVLEILALNEMQKWKQAHEICIKNLYENWQNDTSRIKECNKLYNKTPKMKIAKKAENLNYILPGAGFFYLKKNKDGFITSSLQVVSLGLAATLAWQKLYVSGFFIGLGLYGKFKTGSIKQVAAMVEDINSQKRLSYNENLRALILK